MENSFYFKMVPELKERFWDIMDAFLSNNDRNEGNQGLVFDRNKKAIRIAPVFDNGASFYLIDSYNKKQLSYTRFDRIKLGG